MQLKLVQLLLYYLVSWQSLPYSVNYKFIVGVGIYRYMLKSFGWIQTFRFTDYLTIIAAVIGIMNLSVGVQTLSRIIFGVVAGINTILIPTYLTSVLPGAMGGPAGTLNQLFIVIGIFFGFWMGFIVVGQDL